MANAVELAGVRVVRGSRTVLAVETLAVEPGEMVAVVGANGAGKSTLLATMGRLLPTDSGQVRLFGETAPTLAARRRCALVLQDGLFLAGSVRENVLLPLALRGFTGAEANRKVAAALALFDIGHLAERSVQRLSGGERQRVNLARALVTEPEMLLLDEPFSALDKAARTHLLQELAAIIRQRGLTAFLVSHHFEEAAWFAERIVLLAEGRIMQQGVLAEVVAQPLNEAVARLVGYDNFLACPLAADSQTILLGERLPVAAADLPNGWTAKRCRGVFAAGAVRVGMAPLAAGVALGEGLVTKVAPGINGDFVQLDCAGVPLAARVSAGRAPAMGERLPVWLQADALRWVYEGTKGVE